MGAERERVDGKLRGMSAAAVPIFLKTPPSELEERWLSMLEGEGVALQGSLLFSRDTAGVANGSSAALPGGFP